MWLILAVFLVFGISGCKAETDAAGQTPSPSAAILASPDASAVTGGDIAAMAVTDAPAVTDEPTPSPGQSAESSLSPVMTDASPTVPTEAAPAVSEAAPFESVSAGSPYSAYYQKYMELVDKYGKGEVNDLAVSDYEYYTYLSGVCVADLLDFNGDGTQDLLVVYLDGQDGGKNIKDLPVPQTGAYKIDVWTYADDTLERLLSVPDAGILNSGRCFITVYENDAGLPVIQLYNANGSAYTNIYCSGGAIVEDNFTYLDESSVTPAEDLRMNGEKISESEWVKNVTSYNKILLCAYLADNSYYSSSKLLTSCGIDLNDPLRQTETVADALKSSRDAGFRAVQGDYISVYLREADGLDRLASDGDGGNGSIIVGVYDIDGNGVPELITKSGSCEADYMFHVYTVISGELVDCGQFSGSHAGLYTNGSTGLVSYAGQMGSYWIDKITLDGGTLADEQVASGEIGVSDDYPGLDAFGLGDYDKYAGEYSGPVQVLLYYNRSDK